MVSGIFRLNCPVAHGRNKGWGHGELTVMRNPEDVAQWRASDKHVIYSSLLSPPCLIETPEMCCKLRSCSQAEMCEGMLEIFFMFLLSCVCNVMQGT